LAIQVCEENEADLIYYLLQDIESPKKIHLLKIRKVLQSLKKKTHVLRQKLVITFAASPQPPYNESKHDILALVGKANRHITNMCNNCSYPANGNPKPLLPEDVSSWTRANHLLKHSSPPQPPFCPPVPPPL